jgi:eukaryotic-like serine/threonine-protein kinase
MAGRDTASRELLVGLYALESGAIDQSDLDTAARAWARSPEKTLSVILAGTGLFDAKLLARLEARVGRELSPNTESPELDSGSGLTTGDHQDRPGWSQPSLTVDFPGSPPDEEADGDRRPTGESSEAGTGGRRFQVLRSQARGGLERLTIDWPT